MKFRHKGVETNCHCAMSNKKRVSCGKRSEGGHLRWGINPPEGVLWRLIFVGNMGLFGTHLSIGQDSSQSFAVWYNKLGSLTARARGLVMLCQLDSKVKKYLLILILIVPGLLCFATKTNAAWSYYRSITVTSTVTAASGTLSNFPMLVATTTLSLETTSTAAGGRINDYRGFDITFSGSTSWGG